MNAIESIPGIGPYLPYLTAAVTIASVIATLLPPPTPASGQAYAFLYGLVHWVAINKGNAKAASAP